MSNSTVQFRVLRVPGKETCVCLCMRVFRDVSDTAPDDCFVSLTLHDGNSTSGEVIVKFCSTDDARQFNSRRAVDLNFTSSGSRLTIWLKGQKSPVTTATQLAAPPRYLPPRMSFVAAFAFVDSTTLSSSSSSSSASRPTSSERPYADSRLQLHSSNSDNAS